MPPPKKKDRMSEIRKLNYMKLALVEIQNLHICLKDLIPNSVLFMSFNFIYSMIYKNKSLEVHL